MTFWEMSEIYTTECIELLFTRTINQIKSTSQDIIDVFDFFNLIGGETSDFLVKNSFNELIKSSYDEWLILKKQIGEALSEKRLDNTQQILVKTNLMIILNYSFTWMGMMRMENQINAEKMGEIATKFYNAIVDAYKEIQEMYTETKRL